VRKTRSTDGPAIHARRIELGLDRPTLAARTDVSRSYLKAIELYGMQPSDRILLAIARGLRCRLDDISTSTARRDAA
jgi:transcriptional regulator with XRE-family HTH domain